MGSRARRTILAIAASVGACNGLLGIEERGLRPDGGDDSDATLEAGGPETGPSDSGVGDAADARRDGFGSCQTGRGPAMIVTAAACVDSTEVTRAQYKTFLDSNPDAAGQGQRCGWNTSFIPIGNWPPDDASTDLPVVFVDWCDAVAFCAWAGKHLCGAADGGGPLPLTSMGPTAEWYYACSHAGDRKYPYGTTYDPVACNGPDASVLAPVGSFKKCEGGFPGLFDMAGNAQECFNGCGVGDAAATDPCLLGGGSFEVPPGCDTIFTGDRGLAFKDLGFRCCAGP
jgi:hypothetical protein